MPGIEQIYSEAVHVNFPRYFANFPPNAAVRLGDYGYLRGDCFDRSGNVSDRYGISTRPRSDESAPATLEFRSGRSVSVKLRSKGDILPSGIPVVTAGVDVGFARGNSILFNAAGCKVTEIENIDAFGKRLTALFDEGQWEASSVVVTSFVSVATLTLIISGESNASIELDAVGDLASIDLSHAEILLKAGNERGIASKFVSAQDTTPLIGLSCVQKRILGARRFRTHYATHTPEINADIEAEAAQIRAAGGSIKEAFTLIPIDDTEPDQKLGDL